MDVLSSAVFYGLSICQKKKNPTVDGLMKEIHTIEEFYCQTGIQRRAIQSDIAQNSRY